MIGWPPCGTWITPGTMPCERISIGAIGSQRRRRRAGSRSGRSARVIFHALAPRTRAREASVKRVVLGRRQHAHRGHAVGLAAAAPAPAARGRSRSATGRAGRAGAQRVALAQRAALMAAEGAAQLGAARAEHLRHVDAAGAGTGRRGSRASAPGCGRPERAAPARRAPGAPTRAAAARRRAAPRSRRRSARSAVLGRSAPGTETPAPRCAAASVVVAEQQVAGGERQRVHRAGRADAPAQRARAARGPARWPARWRTGSRSSDHLLDAEADAVAGLQQRRRVLRRVEEAPSSVLPIVFQPLGPSEADTPVCAPPIDTAPPGMLSTGTLRRGVAMRGSMPPR